MPEELNINTEITEETSEPTVEAKPVEEKPKKSKKAKKTKKKIRTIDEILELPLEKLTGAEKDKLIEHYKEELSTERTKTAMAKASTENAFMALRKAEDDYKAMENFFNGRLEYVEQQTRAFANAVLAGIKGGMN